MDTPHHPTTTKLSFVMILCLSLSLLVLTTTVSAASTVKERCHPHDKKVLLGIKQSFNNSYLFASWSSATDCCREWYMVKCNRTTNRIISLTVFAYPLAGTIPPSVGDLPYLRTLMFHKLTNLTGSIPSTIAKLQHLVQADFSWNQLSGPVPSFFSTMNNLQFLDLSFNRFSGSIPPALSLSPTLFSLRLDRNRLTGSIPDSFGYFKSGDFYLILSHNQLSGPIPSSLAKVNFSQIDFSRNQLTGDASFLFGKDKPLQLLDLSRNELEFDFSKVEMPSDLTSLDLNHNKIFGSFPSTGLENIQFLNVSYNRLCGAIPNVGSLSSLDESAYFHNKCLCGAPLPACK